MLGKLAWVSRCQPGSALAFWASARWSAGLCAVRGVAPESEPGEKLDRLR